MGLLFNLALLIGGAGIFLSANGPSKINAFIDDKLGNANDTIPIDQGNTLPKEPQLSSGKETTKIRDDDFPFWSVLFAPMAYFFKTKLNHSNRITILETKIEKLDKLDELCDDVSYIKGLLDEHLKK